MNEHKTEHYRIYSTMRSKLNRKNTTWISTMVNKWLTDGRLFDGLMLRLVGSDFGSISIVIVCIFTIILHVTHMQRRCRMHVLVLQNVFDTKMVSNVYHSKADTSHHECWFVNLPSENVSETSDQKTSLKICIFHKTQPEFVVLYSFLSLECCCLSNVK